MKTFTIATIVALASVATAQLDNIPSCAVCSSEMVFAFIIN
jgi:hypothetical protein